MMHKSTRWDEIKTERLVDQRKMRWSKDIPESLCSLEVGEKWSSKGDRKEVAIEVGEKLEVGSWKLISKKSVRIAILNAVADSSHNQNWELTSNLVTWKSVVNLTVNGITIHVFVHARNPGNQPKCILTPSLHKFYYIKIPLCILWNFFHFC